jgi:hypothetical protein
MTKIKNLIGRKDIADFPELDLENIAVKIDTGAYTSSIHCHHIEEKNIDGHKTISFRLLDPDHENYNNKLYTIKKYKQKEIKSSSGHSEKRFIIYSTISLFGRTYPIELSLTERSEMKFPVLLGRKLLKNRFIIDPALSNLSFKQKQTNKNIKSIIK